MANYLFKNNGQNGNCWVIFPPQVFRLTRILYHCKSFGFNNGFYRQLAENSNLTELHSTENEFLMIITDGQLLQPESNFMPLRARTWTRSTTLHCVKINGMKCLRDYTNSTLYPHKSGVLAINHLFFFGNQRRKCNFE